ncbi:MAG: hypothetical protein NZM04_02560 [Methylacidiphilales bacterium]|nr:hypothetical protein [Candidatus Methylacidiphilales bacterium]
MSNLKVLIDHFILYRNIYNHDYREMFNYIQNHRELSEMILLTSIINKSTHDLIKAQALIYLALINSDKLKDVLYLYENSETLVIHTAAYIARCILENRNEYKEKIIDYINKPGLIVVELVHLFDLVLDVCQGIHDAIYNEMRRFPSCDHFTENISGIHFYLVMCEKLGINDKDMIDIIDKRVSYLKIYDLEYLLHNRNKNALRYIYDLASRAVNILKEKYGKNDEINESDKEKITEVISILSQGQLDELYFLVNQFLLNEEVYEKIKDGEIEEEVLSLIENVLCYFDTPDKPFPSDFFGILLEKLFRRRYIGDFMSESLALSQNALAVDKIVKCIKTIDSMKDIYNKAVEKGNGLLIIKLKEKIREIDPEGKYIHEFYDKNICDNERKKLIDRYNTQLKLDFYLRRIYETEEDNIKDSLISYLDLFISSYQKGIYPYSLYNSVEYCLALLILKNDLEQKDLIKKVLDCFSHDKNKLSRCMFLLCLNNNEEWISLLFKYADKLLEYPAREIFNLLELMDKDKISRCIVSTVQDARYDYEIKNILKISKNIWSDYAERILCYINKRNMSDKKRIDHKLISNLGDLEHEQYYI